MTDPSISTQIEKWLLLFADRVQEYEAYLNALDEAIGDADHGANLLRATHILRQHFAQLESGTERRSTEQLLRLVGITLLNHIGGAAGPLYGALFLHAADAAKKMTTRSNGVASPLQVAELTTWFRSGLSGIQSRGMVQGGEKTLADTLLPAVHSLQQSALANIAMPEAMLQARAAAYTGMRQTNALKATKGRASYHGARTIGHQDPGATSIYLLIETAAEVFGNLDRSQEPIDK